MSLHEYTRAYSSRAKKSRGFTLIEILVVIGMLAVLTTVVLVAVNPLRQFAQARNSQRQSNVAAILNAATERIADNGGMFVSSSSEVSDPGCDFQIPSIVTDIAKNQLDLRKCLVPTYLPELPYDPSTGSNSCIGAECAGTGEDYDTHYTIQEDAVTNRVTVCAPSAAESAIPGSQPFCLSR